MRGILQAMLMIAASLAMASCAGREKQRTWRTEMEVQAEEAGIADWPAVQKQVRQGDDGALVRFLTAGRVFGGEAGESWIMAVHKYRRKFGSRRFDAAVAQLDSDQATYVREMLANSID